MFDARTCPDYVEITSFLIYHCMLPVVGKLSCFYIYVYENCRLDWLDQVDHLWNHLQATKFQAQRRLTGSPVGSSLDRKVPGPMAGPLAPMALPTPTGNKTTESCVVCLRSVHFCFKMCVLFVHFTFQDSSSKAVSPSLYRYHVTWKQVIKWSMFIMV